MKIFEFNSPEEMTSGAVARLVDGDGNPVDEDGVLHLAKVSWRALASLQIYLENR